MQRGIHRQQSMQSCISFSHPTHWGFVCTLPLTKGTFSLPSKYYFSQFQVPGFHQWGDRISCLLVQNHHSPAFWHYWVLTSHFILAAVAITVHHICRVPQCPHTPRLHTVENKITEFPQILSLWSPYTGCSYVHHSPQHLLLPAATTVHVEAHSLGGVHGRINLYYSMYSSSSQVK